MIHQSESDEPPEPHPLAILIAYSLPSAPLPATSLPTALPAAKIPTPTALSSSSTAAAARRTEADDLTDTAHAVAAGLAACGHRTALRPVVHGLDEVLALAHSFDVVFNLVDTVGGDDTREAELPTELERIGVPYTGCGPRTLRDGLGKDILRTRLVEAGVRVSPSAVVHAPDAQLPDLDLAWPRFIKPARTDGSIGIDQSAVVADESAQAMRIEHLLASGLGPVLIEEYLPGPELSVAVLSRLLPSACVVSMMDFSEHPQGLWPIITYDCKWLASSPEYVGGSVPADEQLPPELVDETKAMGRLALSAIGTLGPARVDLRVDRHGQVCVMDVNPNPDLHPDAGFARAMRSVGITYPMIVDELVRCARAHTQRELRLAHSLQLGA